MMDCSLVSLLEAMPLFLKWYPNVVAVVKGNTELVISSSE